MRDDTGQSAPNMKQFFGLTVFRAIKYDPPGPTACGVTCARFSS
jgi:hypothetical protein